MRGLQLPSFVKKVGQDLSVDTALEQWCRDRDS